MFRIEPEVSSSKVEDQYRPIVDEVLSRSLAVTEEIHSIYLYGSVATGTARSPTSDLDMMVLLDCPLSEELAATFDDLKRVLSAQHRASFREVGLGVAELAEVVSGRDELGWRFFICVLCVKLYGDDVFEDEMVFWPSTELARQLHSDMPGILERAVPFIANAEEREATLRVHSAMKKIVRAAFGLVMERADHWTVDLEEMAHCFIEYHPEKADEMAHVLTLLHETRPDRWRAIELITGLGGWVSSQLLGRAPAFSRMPSR